MSSNSVQKSGILAIVLLCVPALIRSDQDPEGIWQGALEFHGQKFRIVFTISKKPDGALTATMDSPDQGAKGIPVDEVTFEKGKLHLEVKSVLVAFEGELKEDGSTIEGGWTQGGISLPLALKRIDEAPEVKQPSYEYGSPDYSKPDSFHEKEVLVGTGEWAVHGTLSVPEGTGPFPAIVLVHGSGPNDRDETVAANKPFRDLAWGLASSGIAVLRYEKRTKEHAEKVKSEMGNITVKEETIDDAIAAVHVLRGRKGIDAENIFVLGHSLGGMLIPRIGTQNKDITGFIIMAGSTRPLENLILEQMSYIFNLDGDISDSEKEQLDRMRSKVARVKDPELSPSTPSTGLPFGVPPRYWLDLRGYDPAEVAGSLEQPILVLQGERDYQVTMEDFMGWKKSLSSRENVSFKTYPKLNHLFIEGEGLSTPAEYETEGHVAKLVIDDIEEWIKSVASG